ncbi:hypothetical protein DFA_04156 [Cavenderia fasciculata]|uniref:IPT/TIG domain-containing protein n=1 Tax=Cavenderia fasciculata TaxID=261658 RepID=F4Q1G0_CACFS|nr:uncharacterized protein DFA_04156 [Cavenderia fasciculata]EGG18661.1 hypothetical protein DFA_04156 [Cavenderia fasciculata]|eukprot:XP_004366565.1 hypothetical protein DFA_04156 [Cavenderia fasciculata]
MMVMMKTIFVFLILFNTISIIVQSQQIENTVNGHKYQLFLTNPPLSWPDAQAEAVLKGGYLATVTTQQEAQFIEDNLLPHANSISDKSITKWEAGPEKGLNIYNRKTNKCLSYCRWLPGQPDSDPFGNSTEAFVHYWNGKYWNDVIYNWPAITGYIVEWGGELDPIIVPTETEIGSITVMNMVGFNMAATTIVFENSTAGDTPFTCVLTTSTADTITCTTRSTRGIYDIKISDGTKTFNFKRYTVLQPTITSVILPVQVTGGSIVTVNGLSFGSVASDISMKLSTKDVICHGIVMLVPHRSFTCMLAATIYADWNTGSVPIVIQSASISVANVLRLNQTRFGVYYNSKLLQWSGNAQQVNLMRNYFITEGLTSDVFSPLDLIDYPTIRNIQGGNIVLPVQRQANGYTLLTGPNAGQTLITFSPLSCNANYLPNCGTVSPNVLTATQWQNLVLIVADYSIDVAINAVQYIRFNIPTAAPLFLSTSSWTLPTTGGWIQMNVGNMKLTSSNYMVSWGGVQIASSIVPFTNNQTIGLFVPPGTGASKALTVTVDGQTTPATPSNTLAFVVPSLNSISQGNSSGGPITAGGLNFGTDKNVITATITNTDGSNAYTVNADVILNAHSSVQFTVQPGYGSRRIYLTVNGQVSNTIAYRYVNPSLISYTQTGRAVTLNVLDVGTNVGLLSVTFGSTVMTGVTIPALGQITFTPPDNAVNAFITFTYDGLTSSSNTIELVPVLVSTTNVLAGSPINLVGYYFSGSFVVSIANYNIQFGQVTIVDSQHATVTTLSTYQGIRTNLNVSTSRGVSNSLPFSFGPVIFTGTGDPSRAGHVSISGNNFDTDTIVTINSVDYTPQYESNTKLVITNLANETTAGYISARSSGVSSTEMVFLLFPIMTSVTPLRLPTTGGRVTITGYFFNFRDSENNPMTVVVNVGTFNCLNPTQGINNQILYCNLNPGTGGNLRVSVSINGLPAAQSTFRIGYDLPVISSVSQTIDNPDVIIIQGNNFGTSNTSTDLIIKLATVTLTPCLFTVAHTTIQCNLLPTSASGPLAITVKSQASLQPFPVALHPVLSTVSSQSSLGGMITIQGKYLTVATENLDTLTTMVAIDNVYCSDSKFEGGIATCNVTQEQASGSNSPVVKVKINGAESFNGLNYQYLEPLFGVAQTIDNLIFEGENLGSTGTVQLDNQVLSCQWTIIHSMINCTLQLTSVNGILSLSVNGFTSNVDFKLRPIISSIQSTPTIGGTTIVTGKYFNSPTLSVKIGSTICSTPTIESSTTISCRTAVGIPTDSVAIVSADSVNSNMIQFNYIAPTLQSAIQLNLNQIQLIGINFGSSVVNTITVLSNDIPLVCYASNESPVFCNITKSQLNGNIQISRDRFSSPPIEFNIYPFITQVSSTSTIGGPITIDGTYLHLNRFNQSNTIVSIKVGNLDCINPTSTGPDGTQLTCQLQSGSGSNLRVAVTIDELPSIGDVFFNFGLPNIQSVSQNNQTYETIVISGENFGSNISNVIVTLSNQLLSCQLTIDNIELTCLLLSTSKSGTILVQVENQLSSAYPLALHSILSNLTSQSSNGGIVTISGQYLGIQDIYSTNLTITIGDQICQQPSSLLNQVSCIVTKDQLQSTIIPQFQVYINGNSSINTLPFVYSEPIILEYQQKGRELILNGSSLGLDIGSINIALIDETLICQLQTLNEIVSCLLTDNSMNGQLTYKVNGYTITEEIVLVPAISNISSTPTTGGEAIITGIFLGSFNSGDQILIGSSECKTPTPIDNSKISCQVASGILDGSLVTVTIDNKQTSDLVYFNYLAPTLSSAGILHINDSISFSGSNFGTNANDNILVYQNDILLENCHRNDDTNINCTINLDQLNAKISIGRNNINSTNSIDLTLMPSIQTTSIVPVLGGQLSITGSFLNLVRLDGSPTTISIQSGSRTCQLDLNLSTKNQFICLMSSGSHGENNQMTLTIDGKETIGYYSTIAPTIQQVTSVEYSVGGLVTLYGQEFVEPINSILIGGVACTNPTLLELGKKVTCQFDGSADRGDGKTGLGVVIDCSGLISPMANVFIYSDNQGCLCSSPNGICQSGVCQCNPGYYGINCELKEIIDPQPPTITNPSDGSFGNYSVHLTHIRELGDDGVPIVSLPISSVQWNQTSENSGIFVGKINGEDGFTITITNTIAQQDGTNILFAGETIVLSKNTLKHSIQLDGWRFRDNNNTSTLQLVYDISSPLESIVHGDCQTVYQVNKTLQNNENDIRWVSLNLVNSNFIGRFSNRYIVDQGMIKIGSTSILGATDTIYDETYYLVSNITYQSLNHFVVAMNIPRHNITSIVDPSFSLVIGSAEPIESTCSTSSSSKSLWWIALVAVGGAGIAGASAFFGYKYWKKRSVQAKTNVRLDQLRNNFK